jgi:hypothetical protein
LQKRQRQHIVDIVSDVAVEDDSNRGPFSRRGLHLSSSSSPKAGEMPFVYAYIVSTFGHRSLGLVER